MRKVKKSKEIFLSLQISWKCLFAFRLIFVNDFWIFALFEKFIARKRYQCLQTFFLVRINPNPMQRKVTNITQSRSVKTKIAIDREILHKRSMQQIVLESDPEGRVGEKREQCKRDLQRVCAAFWKLQSTANGN